MLKKWIREYITINKKDIIICLAFITLGLIIGLTSYMFFSDELKLVAINSVKEVFEISKQDTYIKTNVVLNGVKADTILIVILAILSVTLFGKWLIYAFLLFKGISIAIYTTLLFNVFGILWGSLVVLLLVILVNIIYIPALVFLAVYFLEVNFNVFKAKLKNYDGSMFYRGVMYILISFLLMFSSIMVEQIASSIVLNIYTKL